jgi:hypothetical protein
VCSNSFLLLTLAIPSIHIGADCSRFQMEPGSRHVRYLVQNSFRWATTLGLSCPSTKKVFLRRS